MTLLLLALGFTLALAIVASAAAIFMWTTRNAWVADARKRARDAEDKAHAAEIRSAKQIDAMLDRISTAPRLTLDHPAAPPVDLEETRYIPDEYDDEHWNDYVGEEPAEDES